MKCEGKKTKSGSAIIIALLLMAVISGAAFAIARLFYLDTSLGGLFVDSTVAYYASESGIEEGLLRYRFDRNAEVASKTINDDYLNFSNTQRSNLVKGSVGTQATTFAQTDQVYDLNMAYKTKFYGADLAENFGVLDENDLNASGYDKSEYNIVRDESIKLDVTSALQDLNADLTLYVKPKYEAASGVESNQIFLEARLTGKSGGNLVESKKALIVNKTTGNGGWGTNSYFKMDSIAGSGVYFVENLKAKLAGSVAYDVGSGGNQIFLYLKPIGCSAEIGIVPDPDYAITAPYSTVKSTGYYGGVARTLTAKIDRQSGTVYDLFDFVTYQHN